MLSDSLFLAEAERLLLSDSLALAEPLSLAALLSEAEMLFDADLLALADAPLSDSLVLWLWLSDLLALAD